MIEIKLKAILTEKFPDSLILIENQSHLHAGHASSPQTGQSHFHVTVVADDFFGLSRIQRHRMVNALISSLFHEGLHACNLALFLPDEYDRMSF